MTLEETIDYCKQQAEQNAYLCKLYRDTGDAKTGDELYGEVAEHYKKVALWLENYKTLQENLNIACEELEKAKSRLHPLDYNGAAAFDAIITLLEEVKG